MRNCKEISKIILNKLYVFFFVVITTEHLESRISAIYNAQKMTISIQTSKYFSLIQFNLNIRDILIRYAVDTPK